MKKFYEWLDRNFSVEPGPYNDLLRDIKSDPDFPKSTSNLKTLVEYLEDRAPDIVVDRLKEVYQIYTLYGDKYSELACAFKEIAMRSAYVIDGIECDINTIYPFWFRSPRCKRDGGNYSSSNYAITIHNGFDDKEGDGLFMALWDITKPLSFEREPILKCIIYNICDCDREVKAAYEKLINIAKSMKHISHDEKSKYYLFIDINQPCILDGEIYVGPKPKFSSKTINMLKLDPRREWLCIATDYKEYRLYEKSYIPEKGPVFAFEELTL